MSDLSAALVEYQSKDPDQALNAAIAAVRTYCGWHIAPSQADSVNVWSLDGSTLSLETLYLTAVASVTQDATVVASTAYTFESYGVIRAAYGSPFSTLTRLTVAFTHGYTDWPDDVKNVILSLAQRSISDTRGLVVTASGTTSAGRETYGPQFTQADKERLAPYALSAGFA